MGVYGCSHKTVAMGIPMINAIYEGNPKLGLYALPLLVWHPMQLVIGSFTAPKLSSWVEGQANESIEIGEDIVGNTGGSSDNGGEVEGLKAAERVEEGQAVTESKKFNVI